MKYVDDRCYDFLLNLHCGLIEYINTTSKNSGIFILEATLHRSLEPRWTK